MKEINKVVIYENEIKWWVEDDRINEMEIDEVSFEHIRQEIHKGITCGELIMSTIYGDDLIETTGWWEIINWKNIALDLYNASTPEEMTKAKQSFDENWN